MVNNSVDDCSMMSRISIDKFFIFSSNGVSINSLSKVSYECQSVCGDCRKFLKFPSD